jgi:hypothetical protein
LSRYVRRPRPEPTREEFLALLILFGPLAFVVRWIWRFLLREDHEQQGKHDNARRDEGHELPEREPDTADARTDHEHDDQEEERDHGRHVFFPHRAYPGPLAFLVRWVWHGLMRLAA